MVEKVKFTQLYEGRGLTLALSIRRQRMGERTFPEDDIWKVSYILP